jgi:hypothetical protein
MSRVNRPWARAFLLIGALVAACASPSPTPSPTVGPSPTPSLTPSPAASPSPRPRPSPTEEPTYAALDGLPTDPELANRLPLAVMIDDNVIARPQSGFNAASIVYQAPADGGEDRYMLVFQELDGPDIGPVRSGRPYFVNWAAEYRAGFAHYGGDLKMQQYVPTIDGRLLYDINALGSGARAYHRISDRPRPHNGYTSTEALWTTAAHLRAPNAMVAEVGLRPFKEDAHNEDRPRTGSISVPYGRGAAGYTYSAATNSYLRSVAGTAQIDPVDGGRVTARNVVVLFMSLSFDTQTEPGHSRPVLAQIGQGTALVFRDGTVISGTWAKGDAGDLTRFYDAAGNEIALNRGRIFIQVVATGTTVTYEAAAD